MEERLIMITKIGFGQYKKANGSLFQSVSPGCNQKLGSRGQIPFARGDPMVARSKKLRCGKV